VARPTALRSAPTPTTRLAEGGLLGIDAIEETDRQIHRQHRSVWTHEIDLRPFEEGF